MNNSSSRLTLTRWLLLVITVILYGCRDETLHSRNDVSDESKHLKGLKTHTEYTLQGDVFYRVYEGKPSLHPPDSLWCGFTVAAYTNGLVTNRYVKAVVPKGTRLRFDKALVNDLNTHTVILYYAVILDGEHQGEDVLISSLVDDLSTWLAEDRSKSTGTTNTTQR